VDVDRLSHAVMSEPVQRSAIGVSVTISVRSPIHAYRLIIDDGVVAVDRGDSPADVTLTADEVTAGAINAGEHNAQRAFLNGSLRVDGDASLLRAARPVLEAIDQVLNGNA
jgi:putative sterol carrier protein